MAGPNYFKYGRKRPARSEHSLGGVIIITWPGGTAYGSTPELTIENIKEKTIEDIQRDIDTHSRLPEKKLQFKNFELELAKVWEDPGWKTIRWDKLMDFQLYRTGRESQRLIVCTEPIVEEQAVENAGEDADHTATSGA